MRAEVNESESFIGRGGMDSTSRAVALSDLKSTCRTRLESKIIRVLTGTSKVSLQQLLDHGVDVNRCILGAGFSKQEREKPNLVPKTGSPPPARKPRKISPEAQTKLYVVVGEIADRYGVSQGEVITSVCKPMGFNKSRDIDESKLAEVTQKVKDWKPEVPASEGEQP